MAEIAPFVRLKQLLHEVSSGNEVLSQVDNGQVPDSLISSFVSVLEEIRTPLLQARSEAVKAKTICNSESSLGDVVENISLLNPRGKFDLDFHEDGITFKGGRGSFLTRYKSVERVVMLKSLPPPLKNAGRILLWLSEGDAAQYLKQETRAVVLQGGTGDRLVLPDPRSDGGTLEGSLMEVLPRYLGAKGLCRGIVTGTDESVFSLGGHSAVPAFMKASEGLLFPLADAFAFVCGKNSFLAPHERIEFVELQRASGVSATFDMNLHLRGEKLLELGQISRSALGSIQQYIIERGLSTEPASGGSDQDSEECSDEADESDCGYNEESDEDFDPEGYDEAADVLAHKDGPEESEPENEESGDETDGAEAELFSEDDVPAHVVAARIEEEKLPHKRRRLD
uniref:FACT complex subunit SSRP1 n=1 Tax=Tetraselmis sp. GSL018 TaxID=582737 RepID=A0A061S2U9_9CHLO